MQNTMVDNLCAQVDDAEMARQIGVFATRMKYSGSPEELASFRYVQAEMERYGYRTELMSHDAYISLPRRAKVVAGNSALNCITHSFSRAEPAGCTATLVYVGRGRPEDYASRNVAGKIALIEGLATPAASVQATRAGALGQLHISPDEHLHEMIVSPVWGSPSSEKLAELPATVVCTVSDQDGGALRDRLSGGEAITVRLETEVDTGWRKTPLLIAELAGPETAHGDYVLFSGHHDTWHYGVMDNGTANATMMEVARICAMHTGQWSRGLRIAFWSGHSHGRYSGSAWYADEHWDDLARHCVAHVNVDSTGGIGNTDVSHVMAPTELADLARRAIAEVTGLVTHPKRLGRGGDQSFWGIGVPSMMGGVGEQPPGSPMHGKFPHPLGWWWHTPGDLLDKVDPEIQNRDTKVYLHLVWQLLSAPVVPLDFRGNARELATEIAEIATRLKARLDLDTLVRLSRLLVEAVEGLADRAAAAEGNRAAACTGALVAVSRILVPLECSRGDRFDHDPALPLPKTPALQPLRDLADSAGHTDTALFLTVAARRARNRVGAALDAAISACWVAA